MNFADRLHTDKRILRVVFSASNKPLLQREAILRHTIDLLYDEYDYWDVQNWEKQTTPIERQEKLKQLEQAGYELFQSFKFSEKYREKSNAVFSNTLMSLMDDAVIKKTAAQWQKHTPIKQLETLRRVANHMAIAQTKHFSFKILPAKLKWHLMPPLPNGSVTHGLQIGAFHEKPETYEVIINSHPAGLITTDFSRALANILHEQTHIAQRTLAYTSVFTTLFPKNSDLQEDAMMLTLLGNLNMDAGDGKFYNLYAAHPMEREAASVSHAARNFAFMIHPKLGGAGFGFSPH